MDVNFSADFSSKEDQFFKPKRVAAPVARHVSLTVKIRFLHNDPGRSLQTMPELAAIALRTKHHELRCSLLVAIANKVWQVTIQHFCSWLSRLFSPTLLVRHDPKGLVMTSQLAKTDKLLSQRIQTTDLVTTDRPSAIVSCAAARLSGTSITSATGLFHTTGIRNDDGYIITRQRGAVLVTGLIFLVILMLLGTTAMQGTLLEERMAGNLRDETLAFQAAEAALRSGERFLEQVTLPEFNGSDGLYHHADFPVPDPVNWQDWETSGKTIDVTMDGVAIQPRYVVEQLPNVPLMGDSGSAQQSGSSLNASMFRIIARGVGGNDATMVVLQSTYRR